MTSPDESDNVSEHSRTQLSIYWCKDLQKPLSSIESASCVQRLQGNVSSKVFHVVLNFVIFRKYCRIIFELIKDVFSIF